MPTKIRNVHKFKLKAIGILNNFAEGYVEFVGIPSVKDFVDWAMNQKEPTDKITLSDVDLDVTKSDDSLATKFVRRAKWTKKADEGFKFTVEFSE